MIKFIVLLLLASTITVDAACDASEDCDAVPDGVNMTVCFMNYFNAWGIPGVFFPPNPSSYSAWVDEYLFADVNNIDNGCSYFNDLVNCVGGNTSFTEENIETALNVQNDTAVFWVFVLADMQYTCSSGMTGYRQAISCNYRSSNCTRPDDCATLPAYFDCLNKEINSECGKDAAYYECQAEIIEIDLYLSNYPSCNIPAPDCDKFVDTSKTVCFRNLYNAFKLPSKPFPPSADDFTRLVDSYLFAKKENIDGACKYYNDFVNCFGGNNSLFTLENIKNALNVDDSTAGFWRFAVYDMDYTCNSNLEGFKQGFSCQFDASGCRNASDCNGRLDYFNCVNNIINIQCGTPVAQYECQSEVLDINYNTNCTQKPDCTAFANVTSMKSCLQTYFSDWGFANAAYPPYVQDFITAIDAFIVNNTNNLDTACQRYSKFYNCVGAADTSLDLNYFKNALGVDINTSSYWLFLFLDQQYSCGDGLNGMKKVVSCSADFSSCPNITDCNSRLARYNCANDILYKTCGKEAAVYECNAEILELKYTTKCTQVPDCNHFDSDGSNNSTTFGLGLITLIFSCVFYLLK